MLVKRRAEALPLPAGPVDDALACFVSAYAASYPQLVSQEAKIGVAYSGGADSTSLLLAVLRRWPEQTCALHIHHGLQEAAQTFIEHCQERCEQWQIPFAVMRVDARHASGESPEDAARNSRYQALVHMAKEQGLDVVLLGQHADDQVETLLLSLSRGAGLPGLACMPAVFEKEGVLFARPMLDVGVKALKAYLKTHGVDWVEDPTNEQKIYTRNRIRLDILPTLASTFPSYLETFTRSISHIAAAQQLLEELAQQDLEDVGTPPSIKGLQKLSERRQANALRFWLKENHQTSPSTKQLHELLKQVKACSTRGHCIHIRIGSGAVVRVGEVLRFSKKGQHLA
ncbi:MAG: tRNA lysidine(34) synthetase TilS [Saezia sp.]